MDRLKVCKDCLRELPWAAFNKGRRCKVCTIERQRRSRPKSVPKPPVVLAPRDPDIPFGLCQCGCGEMTRIATRNNRAFGHVIGEPISFVAGHQHRKRRASVRYRVEDRGFATPCWTWLLAKQENGYGHLDLKLEGFCGGAHRFYYEQVHGPIPSGVHIDHLCRNRDCVNPAHMEAVTPAENARRGLNTKLTYEDIEEVKRLRADGLFQREVAELLGVCRQTISDIERGMTWAAPGGVV